MSLFHRNIKGVVVGICHNVDVLATTAKTRQSEQGALKRGGIDLLVNAAEVERQIAALAGLQRRAVTRFGKTA